MYSTTTTTTTTPIVGRRSTTTSAAAAAAACASLLNQPHFIVNSNLSTLCFISRRNQNPFTTNKLLLIRPKPRSPHAPLTFSPLMQMQDCTVKMEIDVPVSVAYNCYSDRESIPQWMPFISSVKVLEDKPDLSRWTLKYEAFGRDIQFSWLARNLQPIPNKKIHWRSLEGLPNSGAVRFFPKGSSSCLIELTVSYEVPQILVPVSSALQPFLQSLLLRGLERFSNFAKSRRLDTTS